MEEVLELEILLVLTPLPHGSVREEDDETDDDEDDPSQQKRQELGPGAGPPAPVFRFLRLRHFLFAAVRRWDSLGRRFELRDTLW